MALSTNEFADHCLRALENQFNCPLFSPEARLKLYLFEIGSVKKHNKTSWHIGSAHQLLMEGIEWEVFARRDVLSGWLFWFRKADEGVELYFLLDQRTVDLLKPDPIILIP